MTNAAVEGGSESEAGSALQNPFPGLRPYGAGEAHLFFGRALHVEHLLKKLDERRLLAVVGSSGSGKSSLVLAGILPRLDRGYRTTTGYHWRVAVLRPGSDPIGNLANALWATFSRDDERDYDELGEHGRPSGAHSIAPKSEVPAPAANLERDLLLGELERSSLGLITAVRGLPLERGENLLLVVDQFEELFRFRRLRSGQARDTARAFVQLLLRASEAAEVPVYVMLTMRSDFLGECVEFPGLAEAISDGQYLVPRLDRDQRAEVVRGPVAVAGASIAPALVQRLLNDAGEVADQLPVLQHALMLTFERAVEVAEGTPRLELSHYEHVGEMADALSRHADAAYAEVGAELGPAGERVAELLFRALTDAGERGGGVRRPCKVSEILQSAETDLAIVRRVVKAFTRDGRGFLVQQPLGELETDTSLDISHESLMRKWQRLLTWLDEEALLARRLRSLAEDEREYAAGSRSLLRDPELALALKWEREARPSEAAAARYGVDLAKIRHFLRASAQAKRLRRLVLWGTIGLVFLGLSLLSLKLQQSRRVAEQLAQRAITARQRAEAAEARSARALTAARTATLVRVVADNLKDSGRAAALLREVAGPPGERPAAWHRLAETVAAPLLRWRFSERDDMIESAVFSSDGTRLVTASTEGTVRIWDTGSGKSLTTLEAKASSLRLPHVSPDGTLIATVSAENTAMLWDASSGKLKLTLSGHTQSLVDATFSADGTHLATASWDRTVGLWDVRTGQRIQFLEGHTAEVTAVEFDRRGERLLSASADGTLRLWDAASGRPLAALEGHDGLVHAASFSPDGRLVASAGKDGTARIWSTVDGSPQRTLTGHSADVMAIAWSADGRRLATASADHTARLWEAGDGRLVTVLAGHSDSVVAVEFAPTDNRVITASLDHSSRVWSGSTGALLAILGDGGGSPSAHFSHDGRRIVTVGEKDAWVWANHTGELEGHQSAVSGALFTTKDARVATVSADKTGALWDTESGRRLSVLSGHEGSIDLAFLLPGEKARILTGSHDATAQLWDAESGQRLGVLKGHAKAITGARSSADGQRIVTGSWDNTARVWDADSGVTLQVLRGHKDGISDVGLRKDGQRVVTASWDGTAKIWDAASGRPVLTLPNALAPVYSATFDRSGGRVLTAANDVARLWDATSGAPLQTFTGHAGPVRLAAFTPDEKSVITASDDKTVRVWNTETGELRLTLTGQESQVADVSLSPDGQLLAAFGGSDKRAQVFDLSTGNLVATLEGHVQPLSCVVFSENGQQLLTGSRDGSAALWNLRGELIRFFGSGSSPRRVVLRHENGAERAQLYEPQSARWVDPRTVLWRELGFCASPEERVQTLGESPEDARQNHARCQKTVADCERASFDECARVVERNFDGRLD